MQGNNNIIIIIHWLFDIYVEQIWHNWEETPSMDWLTIDYYDYPHYNDNLYNQFQGLNITHTSNLKFKRSRKERFFFYFFFPVLFFLFSEV